MTTFYLIRHGTRESRAENTLLSDIGKKQVEITTKHLKNHGISSIYASPVKRTQQTAEIIASTLKLAIITDNRLKERLSWGDRKGESFDEFLKQWTKTQIDRNYQPPNGDSSYMSGNRVKAVLEEVSIKNDSKILVVTHGGAIGDFLRNVFSEEELPLVTDLISKAKYIEILECSVTTVQKDGDEYMLKKINNTSHLSTPII